MRISGTIWLHGVVVKLAEKHQVEQSEVEKVLSNGPRFRRVGRGDVAGEAVFAALGRTDAGRYLVVFLVHKFDRSALIISARDMTDKERRRYGKK